MYLNHLPTTENINKCQQFVLPYCGKHRSGKKKKVSVLVKKRGHQDWKVCLIYVQGRNITLKYQYVHIHNRVDIEKWLTYSISKFLEFMHS